MNDLTRYRLCAGLHAPAAAKLLYCYLLDRSDGGSVIISVRNLAKGVGLSHSATGRNLHRLERQAMLEIRPRYSEDGGRLANKYVLR